MAALSPTYLSGYQGSATLDGTSYPIQGWSADDSTDTWDAMNQETAGWKFPERAGRSLNGSFDMLIKAATALPVIQSGVAYPIELFTRTGQGFTGNAMITKKAYKLDQKGGTICTVSFESQGPMDEVEPTP